MSNDPPPFHRSTSTWSYSQKSIGGYLRQNVQARMKFEGVTAHELAKVLDGQVSRRTLFNFLKGDGGTTIDVMASILLALGMDLSVSGRGIYGPRHDPSLFKHTRRWREAVIAYDRRRRETRAQKRAKGKSGA